MDKKSQIITYNGQQIDISKIPLENLQDVRDVTFDEQVINSYEFKTPISELKERLQNLKIIGHRGGFRPDNSFTAFKKANENNVKGIELDCYLNKDQNVYVIHAGHEGQMDQFIEEKGKLISDFTDKELSNVTLPETGEKIPTLSEVLRFCKQNNMYTLVELKGKDELLPVKVMEIIVELCCQDLVEIITFNERFIEICNSICKEKNYKNIIITRVYAKMDDSPVDGKFYNSFGINSISLNGCQLFRDVLIEAKKLNENLSINCWWSRIEMYGIKREGLQEYLFALDCPIDKITADYPLVVEQIVKFLLKNN